MAPQLRLSVHLLEEAEPGAAAAGQQLRRPDPGAEPEHRSARFAHAVRAGVGDSAAPGRGGGAAESDAGQQGLVPEQRGGERPDAGPGPEDRAATDREHGGGCLGGGGGEQRRGRLVGERKSCWVFSLGLGRKATASLKLLK